MTESAIGAARGLNWEKEVTRPARVLIKAWVRFPKRHSEGYRDARQSVEGVRAREKRGSGAA